MRQQCRDAVVVTESNLIRSDRIVLVDHGDTAESQKPIDRFSSMEVLPAIDEIIRREEHLRSDQPVLTKLGVVALHQSALTDRRKSLQGQRVTGTFGQAESVYSACYGTTRDHQYFVTTLTQRRHLGTQ